MTVRGANHLWVQLAMLGFDLGQKAVEITLCQHFSGALQNLIANAVDKASGAEIQPGR